MRPLNHKIPQKAIKTLKNGGVVAGPTETVYGVFGDAMHQNAKSALYMLKGRPESIPVQLMVRSLSEAKKYADFDVLSERLAESFWPGGMTLVVQAKEGTALALDVLAEDGTIGIRIPHHPFPHALMNAVDGPIIASSANLRGKPSAMSYEEAAAIFGQKVDVFEDMSCHVRMGASSVLRVENGEVAWLREGANADAIRRFIEELS